VHYQSPHETEAANERFGWFGFLQRLPIGFKLKRNPLEKSSWGRFELKSSSLNRYQLNDQMNV